MSKKPIVHKNGTLYYDGRVSKDMEHEFYASMDNIKQFSKRRPADPVDRPEQNEEEPPQK